MSQRSGQGLPFWGLWFNLPPLHPMGSPPTPSPHTHLQKSSGQSLPSLMASAVVRGYTGRWDTAGVGTGWSQLGPQCVERQDSCLSKSCLQQEAHGQACHPGTPRLSLLLPAGASVGSWHYLVLNRQGWDSLGHLWGPAVPPSPVGAPRSALLL